MEKGEIRRWKEKKGKKEAKLAARGGRRRWSGLRDTEEVGESDEKSRSRVDLEMNDDETRYPECWTGPGQDMYRQSLVPPHRGHPSFPAGGAAYPAVLGTRTQAPGLVQKAYLVLACRHYMHFSIPSIQKQPPGPGPDSHQTCCSSSINHAPDCGLGAAGPLLLLLATAFARWPEIQGAPAALQWTSGCQSSLQWAATALDGTLPLLQTGNGRWHDAPTAGPQPLSQRGLHL
ncbi:hypothetical protein TRIATDRAFT_130852 [Trichoderma atroviride IMI 206040]|uniref:Uncharacterized protein n=1 Tax=Hypocrea atroviridis (strain ATCC 20476 / IMI 206040) TaxID=452589 RepID=G9P1D6_HYPAI|nr:uncharacterized protein TRIATDRAFT_130852 [Trichoderma atroviride IMI 206040]EHK43324.1 hypothetical protein TRIATDRAFT_130852 [Trichoderma atroviride IMI 206040]